MSIQSEDLSVAPFTGAWIEIICDDLTDYVISVAPFTGAWIEITVRLTAVINTKSHPSRVRGLKSYNKRNQVTYTCRTLHGCVD